MASGEGDGRQNWPAVESNPEVLTSFLEAIGAPPTVAFHDVFGLDPELLAMIPQPVHAIILLHPGGEHQPRSREETQGDPGLFFLWQTPALGNACGSIAAIHSLVNSSVGKDIKPGSALAAYLAANREKHPEERGAALEADSGIRGFHAAAAMQGQTDGNIDQASVSNHFICFVHANGRLWELDGLRSAPIDRGPSSPETLPADAAAVVKREFIEKRPDELNFSLLALGPAED